MMLHDIVRKKRLIIYAVLAIAGTALLTLYALVDPGSNMFPRCLWRAATGFDCPGCGSQRALHALLQGDLAAAWHFNAFMVAAIPMVALMFAAQMFRERVPRLYRALNSATAIWIWVAVITAWWIGRNVW